MPALTQPRNPGLGPDPGPEAGLEPGPTRLVLLCDVDVDADALRALLDRTGLKVTTASLEGPATSEGSAPEGDAVLVASAQIAGLLRGLSQVRASRRAEAGAVLAWLVDPTGSAPAGSVAAGGPVEVRGPGLALAQSLLDAGADDLLLGLPPAEVVLTRAALAHRAARARVRDRRAVGYRHAIREIIDVLATFGEPQEPDGFASRAAALDAVPMPIGEASHALSAVFQQILGIIARSVGFSHGGLVLLIEDLEVLAVVAATSGCEGIQIPLGPTGRPGERHGACPELRAALGSGSAGRIDHTAERDLLLDALRFPPGAALHCLSLPGGTGEALEGGAWAMLFCSPPSAPEALDAEVREFLGLAAQVTALGLRGQQVIEAVRDQTRRVNLNLVLAEQRREAILHYRTFFESSGDGIMVLDQAGRVLYLNRMAEQITGYAAAGLAEHAIVDFVPAPQPEGLLDAVRQVVGQVTLLPFDMQLTTTSGETLVLSVSTSSVLAEHGLAVLAFRDVTEQRELEYQLRATKEFLERLVDSTADAIVAADLNGQVIVFNQGAARLTGYQPEEVIGKVPVWYLYPEGEARRIMAQLRSGECGGVGRLVQSRRTLVGKDGEGVPVSLSASIVYDNGREVATVGILQDLRERLHIEERLQHAQARLALSEKQAIVAELAGTAAHELNQPLTSVMGYAGLLRRRLVGECPQGSQSVEFIDVVLREAERMAEIVRKIGRITRYETKAYVGEARILDLDKAAADPTPARGTGLPGGPPKGGQ